MGESVVARSFIKMTGLKLFALVAVALLALVPFAWSSVPQTSYLVHLEVKTDNGFESGMDAFGSIDVRIYNENDGFCEIQNLQSSDNNFENGDLDVFYVDDLKNCFLFYIPDNNVTKMTVQHHGSDACCRSTSRCTWTRRPSSSATTASG